MVNLGEPPFELMLNSNMKALIIGGLLLGQYKRCARVHVPAPPPV